MSSGDQHKQQFRRSISPIEWWMTAHPGDTTPVLQIVVEGVGDLDAGAFTAALAAASDACPGTRLTRRGNSWTDTGRPPPVRFVATTTDAGPMAVPDVPELHTPLSDKHGPTCEAVVITGAKTSVVFRASHAVMDVHGVLLWAADVFRALRGESLLGAPDTATEIDVLSAAEGAGTAEGPRLEYPSLVGPRHPGRKRRTFWCRRTIDGYHPGLVAKLAAVLAPRSGADRPRFSVPVNLRRHATGIRSTASLSHSAVLEVSTGQSWETIHEQMLTMLAEHQETRTSLSASVLKVPVPVLRMINWAVESRSIKNNRYASHASLAHLGREKPADFSAGAFEAVSLYSLSNAPAGGPVEFDMLECGGRTEITVSWHRGPRTAERAEQLLDLIEEELSPRAWRTWPANETHRPVPEVTVVQRFAEQAAATPGAVAVRGPEGVLTYAELDRRSRTVAHALRVRGIGRDQAVGVLADRSAAAITAIWGILRAGAAYLPLDIAHPDARLAGLLADARVSACLIERPHDRRDIVPGDCERILLDELDHDAEPDHTDADVRPDDLAYVMYTSGSTGRPKGVEIEHRALFNYVVWATREMKVDAGTRLPLLTSLAFDVSCTSIFLPLLTGGMLLLPAGPPDHTTLRALLHQEDGATALSVTPSLLELICELDLRPAGVKVILSAGELLTRVGALRAQTVFGPDCLLLNTYGPTETTIECSIHPFDAERDTAPGVPIGVPTDNSTAHLLDPQRRFVRPGELGELYLGGVQLARGYRGRPDLTRDRFVRLADGSRVYRSGDLARLLPSGELEFAERADDQVKVLGHRIEPAEISQTLEGHPTVARAAVVVRHRGTQTHRVLCAYVIGDGDVDTAALEEFLSGRLPRYMLPATITVVGEIPQTINGKIDVRALPDPFAGTEPDPAEPVEADPVGDAVAAVWASTLDVSREQLHHDDDFHHLGGNSLMMLSMVAAVCREVVGSAGESRFMARLGDIVREPTIERVAAIAREVRDGDGTAADRTRTPNSVPA